MKILFYDYQLPHLWEHDEEIVGGATVQASHWIRGLLESGHQVGVLVERKPLQAPQPFAECDFVEAFRLDAGIFPLNWVYYRYPRLSAAIRDYAPDYVYHSCAGFTTWVIEAAARRHGVKTLYRVANDADVDDRIRQRLPLLSRCFYRRALRSCDIVLCQNRYERLIAQKARQASVHVVAKPFPPEDVEADPLRLADRRYIAWVGRFVPQKNMGTLLDVARELEEHEFAVAGKENPPVDSTTKQILNQLRRLPNVTFVGFLKRSEVLPFMRRAYCLLNTSLYEGHPNTFLEAYAAGTPVVTTKHVDPDGVVARERIGVATSSYAQLPREVRRIVELDQYDELAARCREYVRSEHDLKRQTARLIEILNDGLKQRTSTSL